MSKDLKRLFIAVIIGSLAVMTGCGQNNNEMMKSRHGNGKQKMEDQSKSWMDEDQDKDSMQKQDKKDSGDRYYYRSECN